MKLAWFLDRRGYKDNEIEEAFKKFDLDGNRVLDKREQAEMLRALEEEKVKYAATGYSLINFYL